MIFNEVQYNVTISQLQLLWDCMEELYRIRELGGELSWSEKLELAGLKSVYDELMDELTDYIVASSQIVRTVAEQTATQVTGGHQMIKVGTLWINLEWGWNTIQIVSADTIQVHTQLGISSVTGTEAEVAALEAMLRKHAELHVAHIELLTLQKQHEVESFTERTTRFAARRASRASEDQSSLDLTGESDG